MDGMFSSDLVFKTLKIIFGTAMAMLSYIRVSPLIILSYGKSFVLWKTNKTINKLDACKNKIDCKSSKFLIFYWTYYFSISWKVVYSIKIRFIIHVKIDRTFLYSNTTYSTLQCTSLEHKNWIWKLSRGWLSRSIRDIFYGLLFQNWLRIKKLSTIS